MSNLIHAVGLTHIGGRENHEDNLLINHQFLTKELQEGITKDGIVSIAIASDNRIQLYAISDGMGGHNAGEVASRICLKELSKAEPLLYKCKTVDQIIELIQKVIDRTNRIVCSEGIQNPELKNMGATLLILVIVENISIIFNVGDSRAYFFSENTLKQITRDHTEGQRLLDLKLLDQSELAGFKARKHLNRFIGMGNSGLVLRADVYTDPIEPGIFLLCSDGLSDTVSSIKMIEILNRESELLQAGKDLVLEAALKEGADNTTLILVSTRR